MSGITYSEEGVISCLMQGAKIDEVNFLKAFMIENVLLSRTFRLFEDGAVEDWTGIFANLPQVEGMTEEDTKKRLLEILQNSKYLPSQIGTFANNVVKDYKKRRFKAIASEFAESPGDDKSFSEWQAEIDELQELTERKAGIAASDLVEKYGDDYPKEPDKCGVRLGIDKTLDGYLGGVEGGDLCFIGARPSVGKSAFALQVALNLVSNGYKVGIFSLEMQERSIYERLLASGSGLALNFIRNGQRYNNIELNMLESGNDKIRELKNLVLYCGSFTVADIRKYVRRDKLQVVFVDYLQLVTPDRGYKGNRTAEVGQISHDLKGVAMDFNIPIFPLVQLNREVEHRDKKEPVLADIRESGDIEQDASQVVFLWNDEESNEAKHVKIAKNRNGQLGGVVLSFNGSRQRFISLDDSEGGERNEEQDKDGFMPIDDCGVDLPFA